MKIWTVGTLVGMSLIFRGQGTVSTVPNISIAPDPAQVTTSSPNFPQELSAGGTLVALAINDVEKHLSWKLNGEKLPEALESPGQYRNPSPGPKRTLVWKVTSTTSAYVPTIKCLVDGVKADVGYFQATVPTNEKSHLDTIGSIFVSGKDIKLAVQVAAGPWQTIGTYRAKHGIAEHISGYQFHPRFKHEYFYGTGDEVTISILQPAADLKTNMRILVKNSTGQTIRCVGPTNMGPVGTTTYQADGTLASIRSVELQTLPFQTFNFNKVPLDGPTDAITPKRRLVER